MKIQKTIFFFLGGGRGWVGGGGVRVDCEFTNKKKLGGGGQGGGVGGGQGG